MSPRSTSWLCSLRRMTCSNRQVCHWPLAKAAKQQNDPAQTQGGCSHRVTSQPKKGEGWTHCEMR